MKISTLLTELSRLGVTLWAEDGQLRFKAAAGVMTEDWRARLREHKSALLAHLHARDAATRHDEAGRHQPFEVTDLQLAYLVGRNGGYELGGVGCHSYIELRAPQLTPERLQAAWHRLVMRHDMLRAVFLPDARQYVQRQVTLPPLRVMDWRGLGDAELGQRWAALREDMSHRCYDPQQWPLSEICLSLQDNGAVLHFSIDLLIADFASIQILLGELAQLCERPDQPLPALPLTFRDVLAARRARRDDPLWQERRAADQAYWHQRLADMPGAPELPLRPRRQGEASAPGRFSRLSLSVPAARWQALAARASARRLTTSGVVLAAFAEVLARWSRQPAFSLNLTLLNRPADSAGIGDVVGDFIAVNVLAVRPEPEQDFTARALALQQRLWEDMEHAEFNGIDVLRDMSQRQGSNVLAPVVYTSTLGVSDARLQSQGFMADSELLFGITQTPQVWLDCQTTERNGNLMVDWDVRQGVFLPDVIETAFAALGRLLNALADDDTVWQSRSPVTLPAATLAMREQVNRTDTPLEPHFLHTGFCQRALRQPDAPAVAASDASPSYLELADWALRIRRQLREAGCPPGQPVAIVAEKSAAQIAAVLAVLCHDSAYVPIEPDQPPARRARILEDAGVSWVLASAALEDPLPDHCRPLTLPAWRALDAGQRQAVRTELDAELRRQLPTLAESATRTAYILFTSGTTGRPKGVMLSHLAAWNTVIDIHRRLAVGADDCVLGLASFSFDLSVWDIFGTLSAGALLALPDARRRTEPGHWVELIEAHRVSLWNSVPAHMQMLTTWLEWAAQPLLPSLREVMLSGDWIPPALPDSIRRHCPSARVLSLGGPTETAIWCVWHPVGEVAADAVSIPYGTPLANHRVHVLNPRLEPCPDNVAGEMFIGGAGLAQGYVGDEARTRERFVFHPLTGERLYRSGDIGRYRADGVLEILGREDHQVKIRGHRVELGEVEAALDTLPGIRRGVAVMYGQPASLGALLVAEPHVQIDEALIERCQRQLAEHLPEYMLPRPLRVQDSLPVSANGKVDRAAIARLLAQQAAGAQTREAPRDDTIEQPLAQAWCEVLACTQIDRQEDFFHKGGSSLSAIRLLSALLAQGLPATVELIFSHPRFADMAQALQHAHESTARWEDSIDLDAMARHALDACADAAPPRTGTTPTLLLTGATGYLGSHLLSTLLHDTDWQVICLVRAADPEQGLARLRQAAHDKGARTWDATQAARVQVRCGSVDAERLGLDADSYAQLAADTDAILHNASIINLMDPLRQLFPTNVQGVANIIALASQTRIKPIHYISTIAIHHALPEDAPQPVAETVDIDGWRGLSLTYEQSKIMAETLLRQARAAGVPVNVLRPSTITWARQPHPFINDDAFLKFYRACLAVGAYPRSSLRVNMTPVDWVADTVLAVLRDAPLASRNWHLVSAHSVEVDQVYQWLGELGGPMQALSFDDWKARLTDTFVSGFVNLYFRDGMEQGGHRQYACAATEALLAARGQAPFSVTRDYFAPLLAQYPQPGAGQ